MLSEGAPYVAKPFKINITISFSNSHLYKTVSLTDKILTRKQVVDLYHYGIHATL
jgi:hypothetical protein